MAVINEVRSKGKLTELTSAAVALNNIICVALFSVTLPIATWITVNGLFSPFALAFSAKNILFASLIGFGMAIALAFLVPRLQAEGEISVFTLAHITFAVAVAIILDVSPILATLIAGSLTANLLVSKDHNKRIYGSLKMMSEPIYVIFFVLAGASLRFDFLLTSGYILVAYILARTIGKVVGPFLGGLVAGYNIDEAKNLSLSFVSQSAIAIGLSLILLEKHQILGEKVNAIILGGVILFESVGPVLMKKALEQAGEAGKDIEDDEIVLDVLPEKEEIKILVPIGTKVLSARNARIIGQLSRKINGSVIGVHVRSMTSPRGAEATSVSSNEFVDAFKKYMKRKDVDYVIRVENSNRVAKTIVRIARQEKADLVVMGASGRSNFIGRIFGGVTDRVTDALDSPVLLLQGR